MKSIVTLIATLFAASVFAAEPAKAPAAMAAPAAPAKDMKLADKKVDKKADKKAAVAPTKSEDIQAPYKNLRLKEAAESYKDLDINDHAKVRLLIARTLAVERHKQKWG